MGWLDLNPLKFTGTSAAGISLKVDANSLLPPPPGTRCGKWLCIPATSYSSKKGPGRTNYITGSSRRLNHERYRTGGASWPEDSGKTPGNNRRRCGTAHHP
jgi:hypothetical protein